MIDARISYKHPTLDVSKFQRPNKLLKTKSFKQRNFMLVVRAIVDEKHNSLIKQ